MKVRNKATGVILESDNEMMIATWEDNPDFEPIDEDGGLDLNLFDVEDGDDSDGEADDTLKDANGAMNALENNALIPQDDSGQVPKTAPAKKNTRKGKETVTDGETDSNEKGAGNN